MSSHRLGMGKQVVDQVEGGLKDGTCLMVDQDYVRAPASQACLEESAVHLAGRVEDLPVDRHGRHNVLRVVEEGVRGQQVVKAREECPSCSSAFDLAI